MHFSAAPTVSSSSDIATQKATAAQERDLHVQTLKQQVSDLQNQLGEETYGIARAADEYHGELRRLNESMAQITQENSALHTQVLQESEQRMSLMQELEETNKRMQHQAAQNNRDNAAATNVQAQFSAELEQSRLEQQSLVTARQTEAERYAASLQSQAVQIREAQAKANELAGMLQHANERAGHHATLVTALEEKVCLFPFPVACALVCVRAWGEGRGLEIVLAW